MVASIGIFIFGADEMTAEQKAAMLELQKHCFADVSEEEVAEDFCRPPAACVLAYRQNALIACAEIFRREIEYKGRRITIGGFSPCTKEDFRGAGVGTKICNTAMNYLKQHACAVAFLSVETALETHPLYERLGFKMLAKPFVYANVRGELKESEGGMIAPLCAPDLFEEILQADEQLNLTPEIGYW